MIACTISATGDSDVAAIGASSVQFTMSMKTSPAGERYRLAGTVGFWYLQAANPTVVKNTAPAVYVPAGEAVFLTTAPGSPGVKVAVIQDGAGTGFASLARCSVGR